MPLKKIFILCHIITLVTRYLWLHANLMWRLLWFISNSLSQLGHLKVSCNLLWWASFCIPTTGQMHSRVSCFTFLCPWRDLTDLNTNGQRSHIFSVSVSSILTSSTSSMWRFSSSILISSSSILTSASSSVLSRISDDETTLVTVMEGPRCGTYDSDLDCDEWGHPFPMDVDGQGQVTALLWQQWWWGWGKPGDRVWSYWCQYPGTQSLRIQFKLLHF